MTYQQRAAAGHPVRLDPRLVHVVGRDQLLADIETGLAAGTRPSIVALCGLGGVGKTTAALEYAHRQLDRYHLVWLFHAEDATALLTQFHELAQLIDPTDLLDRSDPVARVHAALAGLIQPWLLVFDNIRDHATARHWLPPKGLGHVLVTTQDGHWPARQAIQVDTLTPETAAGFLLSRTGEHDNAAARAIAVELGSLPLALAQASAYMETTGRSLTEYLNLLRADRVQVLQRGASAGHSVPVVSTWSLALTDLAATSPGSVTLVRLLAFLAPEDIPFRLLFEPVAHHAAAVSGHPEVAAEVNALRGNTFALDDAVAGLRRHSLIGPPTTVVSIHRLVQAVTIDQLQPDQRAAWRTAAAALIEDAVPANTGFREAWAACAHLLPHAQAVIDPLADSMKRLAESFSDAGDYPTAREVWKTITEAHTARLGAEHPHTLTARHKLARWTGEAGDVATARDMFAALLPVRERVLGAEHPDTLATRHDLAATTGEAGDAVAARDMFAALLPVRERVLGAEHPHTLTTWGFLARWTGDTGDLATARDLISALLPVRQRVLGAEHPDTLSTLTNLARFTGQAGDAATARDLFATLLPVRERVSGAEHPHTLTVRQNLARMTGEAGDATGARDLYAALVPVRERVSGAEHPDTMAARHSLAYWTGEAGDATGARDLYAALVSVRERVSGAEHPDTLTARHNLAYWTGEAGDATGARDLYAALVPVRERVLGAEHPGTLTARHNLAYWTGEAGDATGARDLYAALVPVRERVLGAEHPGTLTARHNLAYWTGEAGDATGARDLYAALVVVRQRVLGAKHPDTLISRERFIHWNGLAGGGGLPDGQPTGQLVRTLTGHVGWVHGLAFDSEALTLATAGEDSTVRIWDVRTGNLIHVLNGHIGPVRSVTFSPENRVDAMSLTIDTEAEQDFDEAAKKTKHRIRKDPAKAAQLAATPALQDEVVEIETRLLRDIVSYLEQEQMTAEEAQQVAKEFLDVLPVENEQDLEAKLRGLRGVHQIMRDIYADHLARRQIDASLSRAGSRGQFPLASCGDDGTVHIWDAGTGDLLGRLTGHSDAVRSLAYRSDGAALASAGDDETARMWDTLSGVTEHVLTGHSDWVRAVAYHPDGASLASASDDHTIRIWNAASGAETHVLRGHESHVNALAYAQDGLSLASAGDDKTVRIWRPVTGELVRVIKAHDQAIHSVAYGPNGTKLASASADRTLGVWDAATGDLVYRLSGFDSAVLAVAFSPDGTSLATAGFATAQIWEVALPH